MTDEDNADELALLENTSPQAESVLHTIEQAPGCVDLYVNANKIEYICFKLNGVIFTLSSKSLKLVDQFTYLGSRISSTESDVGIHLTKAGNALDRLSII